MQELKEEFRKIYETSENPTEGMLSISEWLAKSSSVFTKSCQTIRNWFGEIISYFERRTTNGVVEGINISHKSQQLPLINQRGRRICVSEICVPSVRYVSCSCGMKYIFEPWDCFTRMHLQASGFSILHV